MTPSLIPSPQGGGRRRSRYTDASPQLEQTQPHGVVPTASQPPDPIMDVGNEFGFVQTYLPQHIIAIRLLIAAVLGAMIGFEREWHTAEAGLRTHILVSVAAELFTILAFEIFHTIAPDSGGVRADPIRAVEAVTAGIAFLGAGAIFKSGSKVQ